MIEKPCFYQLIPVDIHRHFADDNAAQFGYHYKFQCLGLFQCLLHRYGF